MVHGQNRKNHNTTSGELASWRLSRLPYYTAAHKKTGVVPILGTVTHECFKTRRQNSEWKPDYWAQIFIGIGRVIMTTSGKAIFCWVCFESSKRRFCFPCVGLINDAHRMGSYIIIHTVFKGVLYKAVSPNHTSTTVFSH